jgi:hypothetical protein
MYALSSKDTLASSLPTTTLYSAAHVTHCMVVILLGLVILISGGVTESQSGCHVLCDRSDAEETVER